MPEMRGEVPSLKLDWATHAAARFAVENWHYSGILPTGKLVKIGVWEGGGYIGAVIFSRGASPYLGDAYGLGHTEICELTRVALREHRAPVSRIVSVAIRFLRKFCPCIRLVVSFADPEHGHIGGIYKAGNWIYTGRSHGVVEYFMGGRWRHTRGAYWLAKGKNFQTRTRLGKHRYLFSFDASLKEKIEASRKPYPRAGGVDRGTPDDQSGGGGAIPTPALHPSSGGTARVS